MRIVADSSPLIGLAKIGKLNFLRYDIIIPTAVFDGIRKSRREYGKELYAWGKDKVTGVRDRRAVKKGLSSLYTNIGGG